MIMFPDVWRRSFWNGGDKAKVQKGERCETLQYAFNTFPSLPNQDQVRFLSFATSKVLTNSLQPDCSPEYPLYTFGHEMPVFFLLYPLIDTTFIPGISTTCQVGI